MRQKSFLSIRGFVIMTFCALFVVVAASLVEGQSGRRVPKKPESPDPRPPAQSEPPITPSEPKEEKPRTPILVVKNLPYMNSSNIVSSIVMEGFIERMQQSNAVKVRPAGKDMNRKEASDIAKASADTYVVLIQLDVDPIYSSREGVGYVDPSTLYVDYVVFTPGTGKTKSSGHVYQRRGAIGGSPLPVPTPRTAGGTEYTLRNAGRETADRVLDALGLTLMRRN
jgi:predicted transcriptional regulator